MYTLPSSADQLPAWTGEAIALLTPALGVMAKPVVINNLKRAAADPNRMRPEEAAAYLEKVHRGIITFAAPARADQLVSQLRLLLPR